MIDTNLDMPKMELGLRLLFMLTVLSNVCTKLHACPSECGCVMTTITQKDESGDEKKIDGKKTACTNKKTITSVEYVTKSEKSPAWMNNTIILNLSDNKITILKNGSFIGLQSLMKLDLSNNDIQNIEPDAFNGLDNLEKLDLSGNKLSNIEESMFEGLPKLKLLNVSGNLIKTINKGTFDSLSSLKKLDFKSDYLECYCPISWIAKWMKKEKVSIDNRTTCAFPSELRGKSLKQLRRKDLHCDHQLELSVFEILPSASQIVFQGDSLPFSCRVSINDPSIQVHWVREGNPVQNNASAGIRVWSAPSLDGTEVTRHMVLDTLRDGDQGVWSCQVNSTRGSVAKMINIVVMPKDTVYCEETVSRTDKGVFVWPKSVARVRVELVCEHGASSLYTGDSAPHAFHRCSSEGKWEDLDTSQCQYSSDLTKGLHYLAGINLNNMTKVDQLKQSINNPRAITNKMDVIYIAQILETMTSSIEVKSPEKILFKADLWSLKPWDFQWTKSNHPL